MSTSTPPQTKIKRISARSFDEWFPTIAPLLAAQNAYHRTLDCPCPEEFDPENYNAEESYREMSEKATLDCFAAIDGQGNVAGFVSIMFCSQPGIPYDIAHILDLFVDEKHRHQGIATALMEEALSWIDAHIGVGMTILEVWAGNEGVMDFYAAHGFVERNHGMIRC